MRLRRVYLKGAAALAAVAALLAIATVLRGDFGDTEAKIFATIAATFVAGSAVMAGMACLAHGARFLGRAGIALAAGDERPVEHKLGSLDGVRIVAVRQIGKRVVRIGDREIPLAQDESVALRRG